MKENKKSFDNKYICKLCCKEYDYDNMSDEHYPAKSVGNDDVGVFDVTKLFDLMMSNNFRKEIIEKIKKEENIQNIYDDIFDNQLFKSTFPKGRTARTLCRKCNTFLGNYDEAYLKFFDNDGNPQKIKGFTKETKYKIIKSIYAKFLSIPEAIDEKFDFVDFIKDSSATEYNGIWNLYLTKRDYTSDLLGLKNIETGKLDFDEGVVYELSDEKFIFNLMNFKIHSCFKMTNIFDILKNNYILTEGVDESGGYHGQLMFLRLFSSMNIDDDIEKN